ncbi:hypothetical protein [Mycobacterium sp.]|uniref:hypothetical protein n=1 Tax=Mycobacterium sp. TaxID=1785 RepID=UPI0025F190B2|nr:hypothetical protein [Mycobacterium sp.]
MSAVGYHWAPANRRASIADEGLRIGCRPAVNGIEDDHRNPWISLSPTPAQAWMLSAGALAIGGFRSEATEWDLWQTDVTGIDVHRCAGDYPEIRVLQPIPKNRVAWVASRPFPADPPLIQAGDGGAQSEKCCHSDEIQGHRHTLATNASSQLRPRDHPNATTTPDSEIIDAAISRSRRHVVTSPPSSTGSIPPAPWHVIFSSPRPRPHSAATAGADPPSTTS